MPQTPLELDEDATKQAIATTLDTVTVTLRPDKGLKARLEQAAKSANQSINQWAITRLRAHFSHEQENDANRITPTLEPLNAQLSAQLQEFESKIESKLEAIYKLVDNIEAYLEKEHQLAALERDKRSGSQYNQGSHPSKLRWK